MKKLVLFALIFSLLLTGCASEPAEEGHNHETAPTTGVTESTEKKHDHKTPIAVGVKYTEVGDKYTLTIKDCEGNVLFTKENMEQKGLAETISDSVFSISWILNSNPGGYETIYIDRLHCCVSDVIAGEQATDGTRLLYAEEKDGALVAIICDLFDKEGFHQEATLADAYMKGDYVVLGSRLVEDDKASIAYLVDGDGLHNNITYELYPDGKPTKKTETTKKTEKTESKETKKTKK